MSRGTVTMIRLITVILFGIVSQVDGQVVIVTGVVENDLSGDGISTVSVIQNDRVLATTAANGSFTVGVTPSANGTITLGFRRLGFSPHATTLQVNGRDSIRIGVTLRPIATSLEEIVVDGSAITIRNPGLIGFYERREEGRGRYITEREIDRAKSFELTTYLDLRLRIGNLKRGCPPLSKNFVYLDGILWPDWASVNQMFAPTTIGGIEVYGVESVHLLPREFIPPGPVCTVTLVWTREPLPPSAIQLGLYAGSRAFGTGPGQDFIGGQIIFPLRAGTSTLKLHAGFASSTTDIAGDRWHANLGISLMPLGYGSNWYAGGGVTLKKEVRSADLIVRPQVFTGAFVRIGILRPFVETRMVGGKLLVLTGLNLLFGPE